METVYKATELEAAALVWAFRNALQYFDEGPFTVVTDHNALRTALQTTSVDKRQNQRLNNWSLFLSTFIPRYEQGTVPNPSKIFWAKYLGLRETTLISGIP